MSYFDSESVICAVATPPGIGGISVIRICGNESESIIRKLCSFLPDHLESHKIYYGYLIDPTSNQEIDEVLVSYFKKGRSFTGNAVFEISCHGGLFLTKQILEKLILNGARLAEKGEFTYRAFSNGRMDLIQAESILSLIQSGSEKQTSISLSQLRGHLSEGIQQISDELTLILANLEANIDFATEDIEIVSAKEFITLVGKVIDKIKSYIKSYETGKQLNEGIKISLVGLPNAGKSSFLNSLVGFDKAIVADIPGTTRDVVESSFFLDGFPFYFSDTAGIHKTDDVVEKLGIDKSVKTIYESDFIFYIHDISIRNLDIDKVKEIFKYFDNKKCIFINCKSDLEGVNFNDDIIKSNFPEFSGIQWLKFFNISNKTKSGFEEIQSWLSSLTEFNFTENSAVITQARHFELLSNCLQNLNKSIELMSVDESPEFIASEMQMALRSIYEILGKTYDDQVMDKVFRQFCIGK